MEVVQRAWSCLLKESTPFMRLDWLLQNTTCFLKNWSDGFIGNVKFQLEVVKEVIIRLQMARDR
jgi:hypothetical protein